MSSSIIIFVSLLLRWYEEEYAQRNTRDRRNAWVKFERLDISFYSIYSLTSPYPPGKEICSGCLLKSIMHALFKFSSLADGSVPKLLRKTMGAATCHSARLTLKSILTLVNINITPEETYSPLVWLTAAIREFILLLHFPITQSEAVLFRFLNTCTNYYTCPLTYIFYVCRFKAVTDAAWRLGRNTWHAKHSCT